MGMIADGADNGAAIFTRNLRLAGFRWAFWLTGREDLNRRLAIAWALTGSLTGIVVGDETRALSTTVQISAASPGNVIAAEDGNKVPAAQVLKDAKPIDGLIRTYRPEEQLIAEFQRSDYNNEYIVLISIARGIGQTPLLGGMTWGFGDDWIVQFRRVGEQVHLIRKNVRFRANKNSPEANAVHNAYTDSVLFSLPIITQGPNGGDLVDLTPVFMSDLPQISQILPGFGFAPQKSVWEKVKGFERNLEIEVAATYASGGNQIIDSVADSRGVTLNVHYSISRIPQSDYQPRVADDRVGYFMTVVKDYSDANDEQQFVRYINRWNLKKADPAAMKSVPKEPIVFWIEKTVPFKYRKPIADGIAEWNKAFERAGFLNAIEVRQQPDDVTWDPEDINYNTFRWITSNAGMAMGPSRVNPYTGQILDADIIFDADFLDAWNSKFDTFGPEKIASLTGGPLNLSSYQALLQRSNAASRAGVPGCEITQGMSLQFAFGRAALAGAHDTPNQAELREKLVMQGLKEVTMHEVGHTLGLRHNFKASTFLSLDEMNDPEKTKRSGLAASVMDYLPPNIVPAETTQGDFYSTTVGPYDEWAIEYGYKELPGGTEMEQVKLHEIAARSGEPGLGFATDENTRGIDPDPYSNRFDLGKDPIEFATRQAKIVKSLMPKVVDRLVADGDGYSTARQAFNVLLAEQGRAMFFAARYVGGLDLNRSHKGDKDAPPPLRVVEAAKQRAALKLLAEQVFSDQPYDVDPKLYGYLVSSQWSHWGVETPFRPDFPVHEVISSWQMRVLEQLLSPLTLTRLHDSELQLPADQDAFTTAELLESLTDQVFAEFKDAPQREFSNRQPAVSSLRRNLQRNYLAVLADIALSRSGAPQDCQAIAFDQLSLMAKRLESARQREGLDAYTRAHLTASIERIRKVLDASMTLYGP